MTVIGPIDHETWMTMRHLRGALQYDKSQNNPKLSKAITWLDEEYRFYLDGVLRSAA